MADNVKHIESQPVENMNIQEVKATTSQVVEEQAAPNFNLKTTGTHPFIEELDNFEPTEHQLSSTVDLKPPKSLKEIPLVLVETKDELDKLATTLQNEKEIAVDTEYSDHGYKFLVCLVQISTNTHDYVIDTIKLGADMGVLQPVFKNANVVKVFHDAYNDLKWLQEDFHLFVVNLFDTKVAMEMLQYPKVGLQAVLADDYQIVKNTNMQRADFRLRVNGQVPQDYIDYARTDSHFLLHIYYNLKNKLIESGQLRKLLDRCTEACKVIHDICPDPSYNSVVEFFTDFHSRQLMALKKVNLWRHRIAKELDKNPGMILSKANMKQLVMEMPQDPGHIMRIAKSKFVKNSLDEIKDIFIPARQGPDRKRPLVDAGFEGEAAPNKFKRNFGFQYNRGGHSHKKFRGNRRGNNRHHY